MSFVSNPRRTHKPGEPRGLLEALARDAFKIVMWLIGAFLIGTAVTFGICLAYGLPLVLAPIGGAVAAVLVAVLALALSATSVFDIFS